MAEGTYWNGKRFVKMEDFRRPPPDPNKSPKKHRPRPAPKPAGDHR